MKPKTVSLILIIMFLHVPSLAVDIDYVGHNASKIPWEIIAKKFMAKKPFCTIKNKDEKDNFAFDPNAMVMRLPSNIKIPQELTDVELNLSEWQQNQWVDLPQLLHVDPNKLTIDINTRLEGFYTLPLIFNKNDIGKENIFHAIVVADWKNDLLAWCKKNKEQIEINRDPKLIYSSIAVSHFDNLMELIDKSAMLTENILSALSNAVKAKEEFEIGNIPDFVIGLNKLTLKRFEGSQIAQFALHIPEEYAPLNEWPIYIHVARDTQEYGQQGEWSRNLYHKGMLDMWWHVYQENLEWKDYVFMLDIFKNKLNINEERIYLYGFCGNGITTMDLAVHHPDQWAECIFSTGNSYRHLAGNTLNLSINYDHIHQSQDFNAYSNFAKKCFDYYGCKKFKSTNTHSAAVHQGSLIPQEVRIIDPNRILYTIDSSNNPKAYWVKIDGREDENITGTIDASIEGQKILIKSNNINAYSLDLVQAPIDCNKPIEIFENGKSIGITTGKIFSKKPQIHTKANYIKNSLHGPIQDVFTDSYVIIYGNSGSNIEFMNSCKTVAKDLAKGAPCISDVNFSEELINTNNLVLVGTSESNKLLFKIAKKLPIQINDNSILANKKSYKGDIGIFFVHPNPLNSQKYVAVFSGTSTRAMENIIEAYSQSLKTEFVPSIDVGIFEIIKNSTIKWHIVETFNTVWGWHEQWDEILTVAKEEHPKWQWQQLAAKIIRKQIGADVVLLEDVFRFEDSIPYGQITYRDLFNTFKNYWIVKVKLKSKELRRVAMAPFNNKQKVIPPAIDGLVFSAGEYDKNEILAIGELKKDQMYTIACHYKSLNGTRLNLGLDDYEIIDEGYLVPLLKESLFKYKNYDLDIELNNLKPNIF